MPATLVVGVQTGDEAKGAVTDVIVEEIMEDMRELHLSPLAHSEPGYSILVVRAQGGTNAGHTIYMDDGTSIVLHYLSGAVKHEKCYLGQTSAVVNDLLQWDCEFREVEAALGRSIRAQVMLDNLVMVLFPYHRFADFALEDHMEQITGSAIGSTGRGIKPAYMDEVRGLEIRLNDFEHPQDLAAMVRRNCQVWEGIMKGQCGVDRARFRQIGNTIEKAERRAKEETTGLVSRGILSPEDFDYRQFMAKRGVKFDADRIAEVFIRIFEKYRSCVADVSEFANRVLVAGGHVILEGAQAGLLDLRYSKRTSRTHSQTITGAILASAGIAPYYVSEVYGVAKAYGTAVGSHILPTEIQELELREKLMMIEYGSTTGRQRKVYYINMPEDRLCHRIMGTTKGVMNKLDMLSGARQILVCGALMDTVTGKVYTVTPLHPKVLRRCLPLYWRAEGWSEDISGCRKFEELPVQAQDYVRIYEKDIRHHVNPHFRMRMVGVGPRREEKIKL